jgi:transketolase
MAAPQTSTKAGHVSLRDVFGEQIVSLGARDERIMMLDADLATSTRTGKFRDAYPRRHINVGIAEQNMVGIAAGLALGGYVPFVNTFAAFLTRRACDQIAISVAYPKLNVKLFGFHAGINLGEDGATQQAVEDLAIMHAIPGIRVYVPIDGNDLARAMNEVVDLDGPTYVRLSRFPGRPCQRLPQG